MDGFCTHGISGLDACDLCGDGNFDNEEQLSTLLQVMLAVAPHIDCNKALLEGPLSWEDTVNGYATLTRAMAEAFIAEAAKPVGSAAELLAEQAKLVASRELPEWAYVNCPRCGVLIRSSVINLPTGLCYSCVMVANGCCPGGVMAGCDERPGLRPPEENAQLDSDWNYTEADREPAIRRAQKRHDSRGPCAYCATNMGR